MNGLGEAACGVVPAAPRDRLQLVWWLYFALYYQDELLQMLAGVSDESVASRRSALRVFFDTPGFQHWSFHHRDRVATADSARLKLDAKQLIFKYSSERPQTSREMIRFSSLSMTGRRCGRGDLG